MGREKGVGENIFPCLLGEKMGEERKWGRKNLVNNEAKQEGRQKKGRRTKWKEEETESERGGRRRNHRRTSKRRGCIINGTNLNFRFVTPHRRPRRPQVCYISHDAEYCILLL